MFKSRYSVGLAFAFCLATTTVQDAHSQQTGCEDKLFKKGANYTEREGGLWTITYVGHAAVSFDDIDSYNDAYDEAEMVAQAGLANWLKVNIKSDKDVERMVDESSATIQVPGSEAERAADKEQKVRRIKGLRASTEAVLRGVLTLDDCQIKGREVRVVVGLKPETIQNAGNSAEQMGQSLVDQPTPTSGNTSNSRNYSPSSRAGSGDGQAASGSNSQSGDGSGNSGLRGMESTNDPSRVRDF